MQSEELLELINQIQQRKTESQTTELKAAEKGCPTKLFDTLSAFSNQDSGGIIVFGIDEDRDFNVCGVYDAQDLQKRINEQCKQMEPCIRPLFTVCDIDGKVVVSAEIPGIDPADRPVFYKGVGRIKGSYIRSGDADEQMNEYEIYSYFAYRKRIHDDLRVAENEINPLFNEDRLNEYLKAVKEERQNLAQSVSDKDILEFMGVKAEGRPTLAGLMTFSKYPQAFYPQLCIIAVSVAGTAMGDTGDDGERFIDSKRITGAIPDMLDEAMVFVKKNMRTQVIINDEGKRTDKPEYPLKAVREAILNALIHRDYSVHTENTPIRIEMYRDRMEITNSGGLYGRISVSELGKSRPETRNTYLANMLEMLKVTENRYSGIPTICKEFEEAGLPLPIFSVSHGEFKVIMKNSYGGNGHNGTDSLVEFCRIPRTRAELIAFTGFSRTYTMIQLVQPLVEKGLLKLTLPEKPKSSKQRYVKG